MLQEEALRSYLDKRISVYLTDGNHVEGNLKNLEEMTICLENYRQTHNDNSLMIKPVETGERKFFARGDISSIAESDSKFKSVFTNAYHPSYVKGSSEWWYFLLFDESKKVMSGKLDLQGTHDKLIAASDLSIYETGKDPIFLEKLGIKDFEASQQNCYVRTGTDHFYERDGKYHLQIKDDKTCLILEGTPGADDQTISIDFPLNSEESVKWVVPSFNGTYEGELTTDGKTQKVKGRFFHDHNRDDLKRTLKFMKAFQGWAWGIKYYGEDALLYAKCFVDHFPLSLQLRKKDGQFDVVTNEEHLSIGQGFRHVKANFKNDNYRVYMKELNVAPRFRNAFVERLTHGFGLRKDYYHSHKNEEYFQVWKRVMMGRTF